MLTAYAVVAAWHRSWCRRCGGPIELGEPVGFVTGVGVACPGCYVVSAALRALVEGINGRAEVAA
jgi:hypothetical protein